MDSEVSGSRPLQQAQGRLRQAKGWLWARSVFLIFGVSESGAGATGEQGYEPTGRGRPAAGDGSDPSCGGVRREGRHGLCHADSDGGGGEFPALAIGHSYLGWFCRAVAGNASD